MCIASKHGRAEWSSRKPLDRILPVGFWVVSMVYLLNSFQESQSSPVLTLNRTAQYQKILSGESHSSGASSRNDETNRIETLIRSHVQEDTNAIVNELLLVTVLKQSMTGRDDHVTFWVDHALVYVTVTVSSEGENNFVLVDQFGNTPFATIQTWNTQRWTVHRPTIGPWRVLDDGEARYNVSVQGASSVDLEVSLYHTDTDTGVAQLVHDTPTAGHQVRTIIDIIGADVIHTMYNISLVTSDGRELASDWLRPAGGPTDPQFETTFAWPTEPVYIRVYGQEIDGSLFERQTAFTITPILIDLHLHLSDTASADTLHAGAPLAVRYSLTNHGPSDTFVLAASVDNQVFSAVASPTQIRLGHMGSFVGSVTVSVHEYSPSTMGLLTIKAHSITRPAVVQSATLFLTSQADVTDEDPPHCQTISLTGNCTKHDVTSPACNTRHWAIRASVEDAVSGVRDVTFADVTTDDNYRITPFSEGQADKPVIVTFRTTCCQTHITLDTSDTAGNEKRCKFFQSEIQLTPVSPTALLHKTPALPRASTLPATQTGRLPVQTLVTTPLGNVLSSIWSTTTTTTTTTTTAPTVARRRPAPETTTPGADGAVTHLSALLNESGIAAFETVTLHRGSKKHKGDYSTLKTASVILGSIGGVAGLGIAAICLLLLYRHRRLQRQRHDSDNSNASNNESSQHRTNVPDLLPRVATRREFSTPL